MVDEAIWGSLWRGDGSLWGQWRRLGPAREEAVKVGLVGGEVVWHEAEVHRLVRDKL